MELSSKNFRSFLAPFIPEKLLFETLVSTVSMYSKPGYGQICGQKPLPWNLGNFTPDPGSGFLCAIVAYSAALIKSFHVQKMDCYKQRKGIKQLNEAS